MTNDQAHEREQRVRAALADQVWRSGVTPDWMRDVFDLIAANAHLGAALEEALARNNRLGQDLGEIVRLLAVTRPVS